MDQYGEIAWHCNINCFYKHYLNSIFCGVLVAQLVKTPDAAVLGTVTALVRACMAWVLFVLRFYGPVNPMGSCQAQSVYLTTFTGQA